MFIKLLVVFIGIPALEIYTLLEFGKIIGTGGTLALIILTGISGAYLARAQGFELFKKIQFELSQGRIPADDMIDGLLVFAGGLVLLTPGFWTDLLGFFCLLPVSRNLLRPVVRNWLANKAAVVASKRGGNMNR
jgi:UPF0716 protein FxsA